MWNSLRNFLRPPIFEGNDEKTQHAELLHYTSLIIFVFALILFWANWVFGTEAEQELTWILLVLSIIQIPVFWAVRAGYVRWVSLLMLTLTWGIMTAFGRYAAGIHDVALTGYVVIFLGSAILLGWHATVGYLLFSIITVWWLASLEISGVLVPLIGAPYRIALDLTIVLILIFIVVFFFIRALKNALADAQREMFKRLRMEVEREELISQLSDEVTERKNAQEELQKLVVTDFLTGLFNRRHFFAIAKKEFSKVVRYDVSLSVMIFDIDFFKDVNDTYGHHAGDEVLIQLGELLNRTIRKPDIPARYGGEEFIVLFPETDCTSAQMAAERIWKLVEDTPVEFDDQEIRITISAGVAGTNNSNHIKTLDELISKADQALYKAKQTGRNRVVCYKDDLQ